MANVSSAPLLLSTLCLTLLTALIAVLFSRHAPEPYMDEVFHVPQAQLYCQGRWREWHPKITTFPGLYVLGVAAGKYLLLLHHLLRALHLLSSSRGSIEGAPGGCSTTALRAVNVVFAAACVPMFHAAARRLGPERSKTQLLLLAAVCALTPLHFFYAFLFYTDVPSVFFTLAAHLAALQRRFHLAGLAAAAAVGMRQTNAVWAAFTLACAALEQCLPEQTAAGQRKKLDDDNRGSSGSAARSSTAAAAGLRQELRLVLQRAWLLKWRLLATLWPLAAVVAGFAAFVVWNGGIVVGDKAHHTPVRHLMQPLYCCLYATASLAPVFWTPAALLSTSRQLLAALARRPSGTLAALGLAAAAASAVVARFTLVHPFLLADNRHYTFYLWRRLLNRTRWARYAAIPAYLYSLHALHNALAHRPALWRLLFAAATCLVLVPAQLIELRYFTMPLLLLLLHMRTPPPSQLAGTLVLFALVNAATIYVYLFRPFTWSDGSLARFLW